MIRRWEFVRGFKDYMITDRGEVFRYSEVKPCGSKNGYQVVSLCENGKKLSVSVHKLVLEAFVSRRPHNHVVHHKDGNPANNVLSNLEWITRSQHGQIHPRINGGRKNMSGITCDDPWRGERVHSAKLTKSKVQLIRMLRGFVWLDFRLDELAKTFDLTVGAISKIINRKTWAHIV